MLKGGTSFAGLRVGGCRHAILLNNLTTSYRAKTPMRASSYCSFLLPVLFHLVNFTGP